MKSNRESPILQQRSSSKGKTRIPEIKKPKELKYTKAYQPLQFESDEKDRLNTDRGRTYDTRAQPHEVMHPMLEQATVNEDSVETSPEEEVLTYTPAVLHKPVEIINIASSTRSNHVEDLEPRFREFAKASQFYHHPMPQEVSCPLSPEVDRNEEEAVMVSVWGQPQEWYHIQGEDNGTAKSSSDITLTPRELSLSPRKNISRQQNKSTNYEDKRQEVLRRKEEIEKHKYERFTSRIREKEQRYQEIKRRKQEGRMSSQSFDRQNHSRRRGIVVLIIFSK